MAMLEIKNIHKSFRTYDEKPHFHIGLFPRGHARRVIRTLDVLRGVDLTVEKGDVVAILGPSGSGKTTLLRCLNFLEPTDSGSLTFDGETFDLSRISSADIARLRKKTAFVFQNYNLFRNKTPSAGRCWKRSVWPTGQTPIPASFPAASSSGWPSPAPLPPTRRSSISMSPLRPWTRS